MASGAFREGYTKVSSETKKHAIEEGGSYIWHLLRDMSNAVQPPKTVQWVHQPRNEANHIRLPSRVVYPRPEDKLVIPVRWRCGSHCDHNHEPSELEVEN
jgi:hypothetical protein